MGRRVARVALRAVTRRRDVEGELSALSDIRGILDAMRTLALMETRKIERFLDAHRRALETAADALAELGTFYAPPPSSLARIPVLVLLGSERGLCGDFNETILQALEKRRPASGEQPLLVAIGSRLSSRLADAAMLARPGPSIAEDVDAIIPRLSRDLEGVLRQRRAALELEVLFHTPRDGNVQTMKLEPFPPKSARRTAGNRPQINLPPQRLLVDLSERYLILRLQGLLYGSLLAENEQRLRHMDGALRKLDEDRTSLRSRRNRLRQEEITEEIEIIMLSAERLRGVPGGRH